MERSLEVRQPGAGEAVHGARRHAEFDPADPNDEAVRTCGVDESDPGGSVYSVAAIASQMRSMAWLSVLLPGRWPLTMMEKAMVLPLAAVR